MIRQPTRNPASPPKETPVRITMAATGLKLGIIKKAALPATPMAARTEITMISLAFGLRPSKIIKNGDYAKVLKQRCGKRRLEIVSKVIN